MKMIEFLLWSNCNHGNCLFCWQKKMHISTTILTDDEKYNSLLELETQINEKFKNGCNDILLVGGEILEPQDGKVQEKFLEITNKICDRINSGGIRFFYLNTNLIYKDRNYLKSFMDLIVLNNCMDRLKFTTSYDIYGRFKSEEDRKIFLDNLHWLLDNYYSEDSKLFPVVNVIITKQLANKIINKELSYEDLRKDLKVPYINFIPYIPLADDMSMDCDFKSIIKVLSHVSKYYPNYIIEYIKDFDFNQDKVLYEYHKDKGYVECTAEYNTCGHNKNFNKVLRNGECYLCKLKEFFNIWN